MCDKRKILVTYILYTLYQEVIWNVVCVHLREYICLFYHQLSRGDNFCRQEFSCLLLESLSKHSLNSTTLLMTKYEPAHSITYNKTCATSKDAVWLEFSLISCAFYSLQVIQRPFPYRVKYRLIWVFAGYTGIIAGFVVRCLINIFMSSYFPWW